MKCLHQSAFAEHHYHATENTLYSLWREATKGMTNEDFIFEIENRLTFLMTVLISSLPSA